MLDKYKSILKTAFSVRRIEKKVDDLLVLTAQQTIRENNRLDTLKSLHQVEFKVYSQWGDDGIIQYLVNRIPVRNRSFVEFGVENYRESNTRFLLVNNNWRGLVFDGSAKHIRTIREDEIYWRYNVTAQQAFITAENINTLLQQHEFTGNIGLLHIDIDGNDYWVWNAITVADPDIVIMEYNALFGKDRAVTVPYNPSFIVKEAHYSRLYFGASLKALYLLAREKGYYFAGCNSAGVNAYFVHNRFKGLVPELDLEQGFVMSSSRQARDRNDKLTFSAAHESGQILKGLPVYNVETKMNEAF